MHLYHVVPFLSPPQTWQIHRNDLKWLTNPTDQAVVMAGFKLVRQLFDTKV